MTIRSFKGHTPRVDASAFIEDSAQLVGEVEIGPDSSVWFNSVLRGDVNPIRIGARTNIQDLSMVHVLSERFGTTIGDDVTVGHHVVLHGCRIGHRVLVGMGAIVMDDVEVGDDCLIAAGALIPPGSRIPAGSLVMGQPAKVKRPLTESERASLLQSATQYVRFAHEHKASRS
jgi:carbonic anhydrase/acetyltransferase-like protein (isoleucine patch superfamily)